MADHVLTSRDKNDLFWVKKRRYMVSSDYKSVSGRGIFNSDMVSDIHSAYDRHTEGLTFFELTGDEFMDPPPTASGQTAFILSVAKLLHTMDDNTLDDEASFGLYDDGFENTVKNTRTLIRQTLDAYFKGCGVDREGNEFHDKKKKEDAQELFYRCRQEYDNYVKVERKSAGYELIDTIRKEHGIAELIDTDETGEDPILDQFIAEHKEAFEQHREKIEALLEINRKGIIEISQRKASKEALLAPVSGILEDESVDEKRRHLLKWSFDMYLSEIDSIIIRLLYRREAVYYLTRWLLTSEPVDRLIAEKISQISDERPERLDNNTLLKDIPGYSKPEEDAYNGLDQNNIASVFELGEELRRYISDHPFQFEAQCLLSISHNLDGLASILPKAWEMVQAVDRLTISGDFAKLSPDDRQRLFDAWVVSDVMCIIGYTITEVIIGDPDRTVKEATETFEKMLPVLSYSATERDVRKMLVQIVRERSGLRVY